MRPLRNLALASASPRRRELLSSLGLHVTVVTSTYAETALPGRAPRDVAMTHARGKAVVDVDGVALGKPRDRTEARTMIEQLSGRDHLVHTAFTLRDDDSGRHISECCTTRVRFAVLAPETIAAYVAGGDGLDKAGAYGIQGFAATLVERIDGDYFTVVGFPLAAFARALPNIGYALVPPVGAGSVRTARLTEVPA
jgi:septum formation protein